MASFRIFKEDGNYLAEFELWSTKYKSKLKCIANPENSLHNLVVSTFEDIASRVKDNDRFMITHIEPRAVYFSTEAIYISTISLLKEGVDKEKLQKSDLDNKKGVLMVDERAELDDEEPPRQIETEECVTLASVRRALFIRPHYSNPTLEEPDLYSYRAHFTELTSRRNGGSRIEMRLDFTKTSPFQDISFEDLETSSRLMRGTVYNMFYPEIVGL